MFNSNKSELVSFQFCAPRSKVQGVRPSFGKSDMCQATIHDKSYLMKKFGQSLQPET